MSKQGPEGSTGERNRSLWAQPAPEPRLQERVVFIGARLEQPREDRPLLSRQRRPLSRRPLHHSCQPTLRLCRWPVCAPPSHLPTRRRQRRQLAGSASVLARARAAVELHEGRVSSPGFERRDLRHSAVCGRGEVRCVAQDGRGRGSCAPRQSACECELACDSAGLRTDSSMRTSPSQIFVSVCTPARSILNHVRARVCGARPPARPPKCSTRRLHRGERAVVEEPPPEVHPRVVRHPADAVPGVPGVVLAPVTWPAFAPEAFP